ncbi:polyprenol monophosphomannose synthase [Patescibacteria group bacterium]
MKTLIILPTYNEIENIGHLIPKIKYIMPDAHILVVDDNSPDGTSKHVKDIELNNVFVLDRHKKEGLGKAYIAGFKWALKRDYDLIFEMDADFSHNPKYLEDFLVAAEHADVVIGSRYIKGGGVKDWPAHRRLLSRFGNIGARMIAGIPIKDCTSGFKCFKRKVLESINFNNVSSFGYSFQVEMNHLALKNGFKIKEIPIIFTDRKHGTSKMSGKIVREAFELLWKLRMKK